MQSPSVIGLITNDAVGNKMAGPGIRYWEFARVLGQRFPVRLIVPPFVSMEHVPSPETLPFSVCVCKNRQDLQEAVNNCRVIITLGIVLAYYPFLAELGIPLVCDLYDPFLLSGLQQMAGAGLFDQLVAYEKYLEALNVELRAGDFFLCAAEKQRDYWLGMLSAAGRVNPYTYQQDCTLRRLIDVVSFGLPTEQPQHTRTVLKGVYPGIAASDKVILWGGGIWNWLDASTLIKAMPYILARRRNVKLLFMGVKRPNQGAAQKEAVEEAIALSKALGLYETHIFFNDWVPYSERQNYLLEADLGVSLHLDHVETRFAFRTRLLDALWTGLPMVCTQGDVLGEALSKQHVAYLVMPEDVAGVAQTILTLLDQPDLRVAHAPYFEKVVSSYYWNAVTQPLVEFCAAPCLAPDKAYLRSQDKASENGSSLLKLWRKSLRAWRLGGISKLCNQVYDYFRWKSRQ